MLDRLGACLTTTAPTVPSQLALLCDDDTDGLVDEGHVEVADLLAHQPLPDPGAIDVHPVTRS